MNRFHRQHFSGGVLLGLLLALAAALALPSRSYAKLPPRPTPVPTATPLPPPPISGGFIGLSAAPSELPLWAQVQWLAGDGRWYDVDGWAGQPDAGGQLRWYVGPDLLGAASSFRWRIYQDEGRLDLRSSVEFKLPQNGAESVIIALPLPTPRPE